MGGLTWRWLDAERARVSMMAGGMECTIQTENRTMACLTRSVWLGRAGTWPREDTCEASKHEMKTTHIPRCLIRSDTTVSCIIIISNVQDVQQS
jgi:hypothetical protein